MERGCYKRALFVESGGKWYDPVRPGYTLLPRFTQTAQHVTVNSRILLRSLGGNMGCL
jgi:hypothetical protein